MTRRHTKSHGVTSLAGARHTSVTRAITRLSHARAPDRPGESLPSRRPPGPGTDPGLGRSLAIDGGQICCQSSAEQSSTSHTHRYRPGAGRASGVPSLPRGARWVTVAAAEIVLPGGTGVRRSANRAQWLLAALSSRPPDGETGRRAGGHSITSRTSATGRWGEPAGDRRSPAAVRQRVNRQKNTG